MNVAIVVAAGRGSRLGGHQPKQFLELCGTPIIVHTLRQFEHSKEINEIITVVPATETAAFLSLAQQFDLKKSLRAVAGGATRAQSVRQGLNAISHAEIVAVHDGVRPLVTPDEIDRVVRAAKANGAAVLTAPVADTIKEVHNDRVTETFPRAVMRRALTPQCFRKDKFLNMAKSKQEPHASELTILKGTPLNVRCSGPGDASFMKSMLMHLPKPKVKGPLNWAW